jgi:hypothetical protein
MSVADDENLCTDKQGDQIGRILASVEVCIFGQFYNIT